MTLEEYYKKANQRWNTHRYEKYGEAHFNTLKEVNPVLAQCAVNSFVDPSAIENAYDMEAFHNWLSDNWMSPEELSHFNGSK